MDFESFISNNVIQPIQGGIHVFTFFADAIIRENVIFRCNQSLEPSSAPLRLQGGGEIQLNSIVQNRGEAEYGIFRLFPLADVSVEKNLFLGNENAPPIFTYDDSLTLLSCNLSFGNELGDSLSGTDLGGNIIADPLFCDVWAGDFTVDAASPCLPGNHPEGVDCGLIGAFGEGCNGIGQPPVITDPLPAQPPDSWFSNSGFVGCTMTHPLGVDAESIALRIDANGDGDYEDGGAEDWTPVSGYADSTEIVLQIPVSFLHEESLMAFEFRAHAVNSWWIYSGTEGLQGIEDDWYVSIERTPEVIHVPGDFNSIQEAVDASMDGDTIRIGPGVWQESADLGDKSLALLGAVPPDSTILEGDGLDPVLRADTTVHEGSLLEDLCFRGGSDGIALDSARMQLERCSFRHNDAHGLHADRSVLDVYDCDFSRNGIGFYAYRSQVLLFGCQISLNHWTVEGYDFMGCGGRLRYCSAQVLDCLFYGNYRNYNSVESNPTLQGGGLYCKSVNGRVMNSSFLFNVISATGHWWAYAFGGGIDATTDGGGQRLTVQNCLIARNVTDAGGQLEGITQYAGVFCAGPLIGNTIVDNFETEPFDSPAAHASTEIHNNLIAHHPSSKALSCSESTEVSCNLLYDNAWGDNLCGQDLGGNLVLDPLLCDWEDSDYRISPESPCWPENHPEGPGCGLIGGRGLCSPEPPVQIEEVEILEGPRRIRLSVTGGQAGADYVLYVSEQPYVGFEEVMAVPVIDPVTQIEHVLDPQSLDHAFYQVRERTPDELTAGSLDEQSKDERLPYIKRCLQEVLGPRRVEELDEGTLFEVGRILEPLWDPVMLDRIVSRNRPPRRNRPAIRAVDLPLPPPAPDPALDTLRWKEFMESPTPPEREEWFGR